MASWALICKRCGKDFRFSEISDTLANHFFPRKPEFPKEGVQCACPNCQTRLIYQMNDLRYQTK
jgi:DNA-directed RNA polymerase subunit RPC12/RpoP